MTCGSRKWVQRRRSQHHLHFSYILNLEHLCFHALCILLLLHWNDCLSIKSLFTLTILLDPDSFILTIILSWWIFIHWMISMNISLWCQHHLIHFLHFAVMSQHSILHPINISILRMSHSIPLSILIIIGSRVVCSWITAPITSWFPLRLDRFFNHSHLSFKSLLTSNSHKSIHHELLYLLHFDTIAGTLCWSLKHWTA